MATKKTNYAKVKIWGDTVSAEFDGPILGCMIMMLEMVPAEFHDRFIAELQKVAANRKAKSEEQDFAHEGAPR